MSRRWGSGARGVFSCWGSGVRGAVVCWGSGVRGVRVGVSRRFLLAVLVLLCVFALCLPVSFSGIAPAAGTCACAFADEGEAAGASSSAGASGGAGEASAEDAEASSESSNVVNERQIPDGSFLYDTSIEALAQADVFYDNSTVVVTGEVVGDRINAGVSTNSSWITLYSLAEDGKKYNPSSVQVYASDSLLNTIDTYGEYNARGTYVQVSGTFHLACSEHQGLSDIHADSFSVVQKGETTKSSFDLMLFMPGIAAVLAGLLLVLIHKYLVEKAR